MQNDYMNQMQFLREMSDYQTSGHEFFSRVLLESLKRHFDLHHVVIFFFDCENRFLSWKTYDSIDMDGKDHPYHDFQYNDIIRQTIYRNAKRNHQNFNHFEVRGYRSSQLISESYSSSPYVQFIKKYFEGYYSVSYAFGINGYIQISCFKTKSEGDFTEEEIFKLDTIYLDVANAYKNFKKFAHSNILLDILNKIVALDVKAYLIVDSDMNIMKYNDQALEYICDILGPLAVQQIQQENYCQWLPSLLMRKNKSTSNLQVQIKDFEFQIHCYEEQYPCGIIEKFYWISIHKMDLKKEFDDIRLDSLTPMEQKVASLMYRGMTYRAIAEELVISYHTVKNHVQNIYHKCDVTNRYELYKWLEKRI